MFQNKASSMVLNTKYTKLPAVPNSHLRLTRLISNQKLLQPLNLMSKTFTCSCLRMLSEIRLLKRRSGRNSCPQRSK